ncbi:MAG: hypothetical protein J7L14_00985 [Candidatus Diapherotrites archaeon]|nr:hypothetical protein [Candidatus Diapherotrites archaeon]
MENILITVFLTIAVGFFATSIVIPKAIEAFKKRGLVGIDMNKWHKPKVAELGGLTVYIGFSAGVMLNIFLMRYLNLIELNLTLLLAAFSTISITIIIGLLDDLIGWKRGISKLQHALLPLFAALPLMVVKIENPVIVLPFFGPLPSQIFLPIIGAVSFSLIYSLIIIPIGVTGAANAANMLAGLNGLEAGLGAIIHATLLIIGIMLQKPNAVVLSSAMLASLLAFLRYNWFPAKIFGGDSLTLACGASTAAIVIISDMEKIGVALFALFFLELILKLRTKLQGESFGIATKEGYLKAPKKICSITHIAMLAGKNKWKEWQVVTFVLFLQALVSAIVLVLTVSGVLL